MASSFSRMLPGIVSGGFVWDARRAAVACFVTITTEGGQVAVVRQGVQTLNVRPFTRMTAGEFVTHIDSTLLGSIACSSWRTCGL